MQKRLLTLLCLFLVVAGLTVFFFVSDAPEEDDAKVLLSNIDTNDIKQITIQRADRGDIVFQKLGESWFMVSAVKTRANMARIHAMLRLPHSRSFAQIHVKGTPLSTYQLDPAPIVLRLDEHEFFFGTSDPLDDRRYVMFNNTIHLLNDSLFHQLSQAPMFFISTRLVPETETISSIQFSDHVVSSTGQTWSLSPANDAVSAERLEDLVETWGKGLARQVRQYSATGAGERIIVKFRSGRAARFDVLSSTPELILGRSDLALEYVLDQHVAELLFIPQANTDE